MAIKVISAGVVNADQIKRELQQVAAEARGEVVKEVGKEAATEFLQTARDHAPVLKEPDPRRIIGNLRNKIDLMLLSEKPGKVTWGVGIGKQAYRPSVFSAFYALWVEYGTRFMDAIPFLRPAFDTKKEAAGQRGIGVVLKWLREGKA